MAEQTLNERPERLAADFDGTELAEVFPTSQGISYKTPVGTAIAMNNDSGGSTLGTAAVATVGTATTEVPTNAQRDGRDNVFTGDNSFVGSRYVPVTVTADHTIAGESEVIVNTDASTTVAITIPSGLPIGTRKKITRIGAYDTTNTNRVRLLPSGTEYITAGQLTDVPIYGNGGTWEIQKVGSLRWEIVGGYDRGSTTNNYWYRGYDGYQKELFFSEVFDFSTSTRLTPQTTNFSVPFADTQYVGQVNSTDLSGLDSVAYGFHILLDLKATGSARISAIGASNFVSTDSFVGSVEFNGHWYQEV